ncbi:hypothetical protein L2E82_30617 [Cichorium intybus]|uniref:Uncharacterized protein n=1 Tax=Cichorium intybus TaxID=13427 RepID=A0ACB9D0V5_CICIN|nr:hypothetical protein L2E82_30617 [Cichorium intybus]
MPLSTIVLVGDATKWENELVKRAKQLKVNAGIETDADLERVCKLIQSGVQSGAKLRLDGRDIVVPGYEQGNFVGPTILSGVTKNMECHKVY